MTIELCEDSSAFLYFLQLTDSKHNIVVLYLIK